MKRSRRAGFALAHASWLMCCMIAHEIQHIQIPDCEMTSFKMGCAWLSVRLNSLIHPIDSAASSYANQRDKENIQIEKKTRDRKTQTMDSKWSRVFNWIVDCGKGSEIEFLSRKPNVINQQRTLLQPNAWKLQLKCFASHCRHHHRTNVCGTLGLLHLNFDAANAK